MLFDTRQSLLVPAVAYWTHIKQTLPLADEFAALVLLSGLLPSGLLLAGLLLHPREREPSLLCGLFA
eukprot:8525689-Prorocentrum_lima.AAC.1